MSRYKTVKVRGRSILEHRYVMEQHLGRTLRHDEHVHHKNRDTHDNRLENLELLAPREHQHLHKQRHPVTKQCAVCGAEFTPHPTKRYRQQTCSRDCMKELIRRKHTRRKLSDEQVLQILKMRADGETLADIGAAFGVTKTTVSAICRGRQRAAAIVRANVVHIEEVAA